MGCAVSQASKEKGSESDKKVQDRYRIESSDASQENQASERESSQHTGEYTDIGQVRVSEEKERKREREK